MTTTAGTEIPEYVYFSNPGAVNPSRVYHTMNCNGKLDEATKMLATEENIQLIQRLGFKVCATCKLRYEKRKKKLEHELVLAQLDFKAIHLPDEFELRVYWHRDKGNPVEIWSSRKH